MKIYWENFSFPSVLPGKKLEIHANHDDLLGEFRMNPFYHGWSSRRIIRFFPGRSWKFIQLYYLILPTCQCYSVGHFAEFADED